MKRMNNNFASIQPRLLATVSVGLVLFVLSGALVAEDTQDKFTSVEHASQALFAAVKANNDQALAEILGGKKELVSCGDALEDQQDRETFVRKYQEMHRLVQEPDGTTILYIGAENWPFPVPLVSKNGKWYFDADAGAQEVLFRRVGRNEANAIETGRSLAAGTTASAGTNAAGLQPSRVDGYYFRKLAGPGQDGKENVIVIAYPAEYRSSGVMTFVVTSKNVVYEKDLGPDTASAAKRLSTWKRDRSWKVVNQ
jgi:Protein of unknown function (DUF2950)